MERQDQYNFILFFSLIIALGLISFSFCLAAEFKKSEVIGNLFVCRKFSVRDHRSGCDNKLKRPTSATILLVFSWITFGIALILISVATSMSRSQPFGEGWLDVECYIVKSGVYTGSGILAVLTLGLTLGSAIVIIRQRRVEEERKVHAQIE